ncbi:MAG: tetratricopeptide repeat protein [Verrucomicrobiales bacterium]|nr:tetratricopeptide repeat protein [Verrucomicrobiales bacterium]
MSESHRREAVIFDVAMDLPLDQRAAHLDHACGGDAALRQRMEALMKACESSCAFLDSPADPMAVGPTKVWPSLEKAGDRIGRYKLLQQIGEGGCGIVYVAEQEEPISRRVALKVIKLGMDTRSVIARFEAERQALALMDHPNIARVLDAGATETGRPYFVMELVRGTKITEYCDKAKLSTKPRLDLFLQVCSAIQHAHQKGVIHRDIKPSNILVTVNDGVAVPKVIDFGIAKATSGQKLTDKTIFTAFEQFIGTPAYMSPEQATLTSLDIDTRSDIYALGVLLYELLTGKTPFDAKELLAIGLDEMRRTIREKEPDQPSTRLSTLPGNELNTTAQRRGIDAPKLVGELRGDLDWIVMKALEKDRVRRYQTASGLARDIERHLRNEPVVACPPSNLYRFQKLVRRNKVAFAAAAAVVTALVIGLGVATWMFVKERAAVREQIRLRQQAQAEAAKSQQVALYFRQMLAGVQPAVTPGRETTILQEILDKTAERIAKGLTNQPAVEAEIRNTLAIAYRELGQYEKSEQMHHEALALRKELFGDAHPDVARALRDAGFLVYKESLLAEAYSRLSEAPVLQRRSYAETATSLENPAAVLLDQGKFIEAEAILRNVLATRRRILGSDDLSVAYLLDDLAVALAEQGKVREAEPMLRELLTVSRNLLPAEHPMIVRSLGNLAEVLGRLNKLAEAETLHREALAMQKRLIGGEHPNVAASLNSLAKVLQWQMKFAEAEALYRESLAIRKKAFGNEDLQVAGSLSDLGAVFAAQGKMIEAEPLFGEALAIRRKVLGDEHRDVVRSVHSLVFLLQQQGKLAQAEKLLAEVLPSSVEDRPQPAVLLGKRADLRARQGRFAEAAADLTKAKEANPYAHWSELGALLVASGQLDAYRERCRKIAERFGISSDPLMAERVAKECLILPASGADLQVVAQMADRAAAVTNHWAVPWFQFVKGLAEYRQGRFVEAVQWMNKTLTATGDQLERDVEAYMVQAMAHHQLKQTNEARAAFVSGAEIERTKLPKLESGYLSGNWIDWIIAHALMREARAIIEDKSETGPATK